MKEYIKIKKNNKNIFDLVTLRDYVVRDSEVE